MTPLWFWEWPYFCEGDIMSADDFLLTSLDVPTSVANRAAHHATIARDELEPFAPAAALRTVQIKR
jgi:hypothetical protein